MDIIKKVQKELEKDDSPLGAALGIAALAIGGLVVARVVHKQMTAADLRKKNPGMSFHQSIVKAFYDLGQDNPFKI